MDQIDDPITPETGNLNGTAAVGTTESLASAEIAPPAGDPVGLRPGFLSELAVAMRATAERERENIGARVAQDAATHVDKVRARAAIETEELRRLAEEDVQHIEEWSASEMERIRGEADQKIGDRRTSLDEYLRQHDAIIETEIQGVDAAVRDYNVTLDQFFAELSDSEDPSTIVARAETLPQPPDLDQVRAQARASAVAMFAQPDVPEEPVAEVPPAAEAPPAIEAVVYTPSDPGDEPPTGPAESAPVVTAAQPVVAAAQPVVATRVAETIEPEATPAAIETADTQAIPAVDPVPVMDPAATADTAWPEKEPEAVEVAPSVEHASAAVRLLRSVAPWTAPTHASSEQGSDSD